MAAQIEWKRSEASVTYHKKGDDRVVIGVAVYDKNGLFNLAFDASMKMPMGVEALILGVSLDTANWFALAVAEHNGV